MSQFSIYKNLAITLFLAGAGFVSSYAYADDVVDTFKDCDTCPEMAKIPAGTVTIGAYEDEAYRRKGERPKQDVEIDSSFAMAIHEVTVGQYREFITDSKHEPEIASYKGIKLEGCNFYDGKGYGYVKNHRWDNPGYPQREDEPVVCVSASDAIAYANWLSEKTDRAYRVPSTVEFEYALRAGTSTPWPWGANPDEACEYANIGDRTFGNTYPKRAQFSCDDGYLYTARVKKFKPNGFGLYDMMGNAWEWTSDCWHDDLADAPLDGSSWGEESGGDCDARVPKGGGWISGPGWARASARSKDGLHYRSFMLGFRLASDVQ